MHAVGHLAPEQQQESDHVNNRFSRYNHLQWGGVVPGGLHAGSGESVQHPFIRY